VEAEAPLPAAAELTEPSSEEKNEKA
jgi:hypothetical protein